MSNYNKELIAGIIPTLSFEFPYDIDDYADNMYFENYHKHTCESNYGLADSGETYENYIKQIKAINSKCLFSGEHGWQGDHIATYDLAEKSGLKYRHSSEVYWVKDRHLQDRTNCHMIIVAKTAKGRHKLNYILSVANEDGFYGRPRIDLELLLSVDKKDFIVTSACFVKGTKIKTKNGIKNIEEIKRGDYVENRNGKWEYVNYPTVIPYDGKGYKIKTNAFDDEIICTADHKFLTTTMSTYSKEPIWTKAENLIYGQMSNQSQDRLLCPIFDDFNYNIIIKKSEFDGAWKHIEHPWCVKQKINGDITITPELMRFLGVFIGDGSISLGKNASVSLTLNDECFKYFYDDFIKKVEEQIGIKFNINPRPNNHRVDVSTGSIDFVNFIYYLFGNCKANTKHIPLRLQHISYELDCELLIGMIITDGYIQKCNTKGYLSGRIIYTTISNQLCHDFRNLCGELGILVNKRIVSEYTDKHNIHHNQSYYLSMSSKEILSISPKSHITHEMVVNVFKNFYNNMKSSPRKIIGNQEYLVIKITGYEEIHLKENVYCLNNNTHSFIVNGVIVHNCVAGWKYDDANEIWLKIADHFKDNFFLELQYHHTNKQKELNRHILDLAEKHNIQIIAGLDSHYISNDGKIKRDMILKYKNVEYPDEQGWFMDFPSVDIVIQRFKEQGVLTEKQIYTAIMNTNIFVNECEQISLDRSFKIPNLYKNESYEQRVKRYHALLNNAYKKEKSKSKERVAGVRAEANEITSSNVVDYFLFNHDLIRKAVDDYNGVLTTTSRGSMSSFYTNKLLGFTTLDRFNSDVPIYPDRFIKADRIKAGQMPDCDFNIAEQEPFVKAAKELLGEHCCYPLMAIEKLKVKSAWQLYSKANGVSSEKATEISKAIEEYEKKLKHTDDEYKDSVDVLDYIPEQYIELYKESLSYQKIVINLKCHACGFLIFDGDIREEIGLISAVSEATGKRTICACVQGGYLDDFGYVKDDFLIVDSVSLTYEFFQSIGQSVPTFEELKEMVKNDPLVWDIYAKGYTVCVNQLEKDATRKKMMKYKAKNISELSSFIAAIRPGFASLLQVFLNHEQYSTGEPEIDKLLEDTSHFMLYQESIMKILFFLNVPMGETYGIIKSISKKKLVGEKKENLKKKLKESWLEHFGNTNNFDKVWAVIESSASYAFNSPHAYSMAGDSLYQAWFKAHYASKFYEVAINHYQRKNNKDKIQALLQEAISDFGYKRLSYRFRQDNRQVNIDDEKKTISPNLSSIKGIGSAVADYLYSIKDEEYTDFIDFLSRTNLNKTQLNILIKLGYFNEFGKSQKLLGMYDIYITYGKRSEISKDKVNIPEDIMLQYAKAIEKKYKFTNLTGFINYLCNQIEDKNISIEEYLANEIECLGNIDYINEKAIDYGFVLDINTKYTPKITLYKLDTGEIVTVKVSKKMFTEYPFEKNMILKKIKTEQRNKSHLVDGKWVKNENEYDTWMTSYVVR